MVNGLEELVMVKSVDVEETELITQLKTAWESDGDCEYVREGSQVQD